MEREEIGRQIAKFKARRLKARLANYGTFVSIFLTLSILSSGYHLSSLFSFLLMLPLPLYFALQSYKLYHKIKSTHQPLAIDHQPSKFSFREFLTQPNLAFRLSLILFFLVGFTTLARLR